MPEERGLPKWRKRDEIQVIMDFGANKTLTGGLALQTVETYGDFIGTNEIRKRVCSVMV